MKLSEKVNQHVDSCRFCWMCHHICPIGNATGHERSTPRARALGISLVTRGALQLDDIMDNIYECAGCGACVQVCVTGWDPVMFTKAVREQAALEGKLPGYIQTLVANCLSSGNAYGMTDPAGELQAAIGRHSAGTDTLLFLGADARYKMPEQAVKTIAVLERAGVDVTVLAEEPASGAQMDYLVGALRETKAQMQACAAVLNGYKTVVAADPTDAKVLRRTYAEYGVELSCRVVTFPSYALELLQSGRLTVRKREMPVVYQDPFQLSRDLGETEEPRALISACADLSEMLLHGEETVWAGNLLMAEWMPDVMRAVAARRIFNAESVGAKTIVTACVGEYAALKAAETDGMNILSIEDLILGGN